jgi:Protein of unknown function (DUF2891)
MPETRLTQDIAEHFAGIALGHVTREYPNKLDHVMAGPDDTRGPRALHPIFYGSFDWHSCVHSYWMLARLQRLFPGMAKAGAIAARFAEAFTEANLAGELAYLKRPESRGFERPYGWAWALMLAAELRRTAYGEIFRPLENEFVARFIAFLPMLTYPIRTGMHTSTAFALILTAEYATVAENSALRALLRSRAHDWFSDDSDAQAWEPSGDDFLSPTLCEAEAMRRLLPAGEFAPWFDAFLPELAAGKPSVLFAPATVSDRSDGKTAHLDGLNLSRAWCMRGLASVVDDEPRRAVLQRAAEAHIASAMPHVTGDYMGEHWLASFATLALSA